MLGASKLIFKKAGASGMYLRMPDQNIEARRNWRNVLDCYFVRQVCPVSENKEVGQFHYFFSKNKLS